MKGLEFPIISTKVEGLTNTFDINDPAQRKEYFNAKAGKEIQKLKDFMEHNTFVANMLGKKNAGKGTYTKLFAEIFGADKIAHISVGDLVRDTHSGWGDFETSEAFAELKKNYRGFISFEEAVDRLHGRSQDKLLPTEFILALLKHAISKHQGKSLFIDGLPRDLDQISYALYFRDLINYREDPDVFVLIDIPENLINERIKYRVICPVCKTPRNVRLLATKEVGYDKDKGEFYLLCDTPECKGTRMVAKEGDELGIEPIRSRLEKDEEVMKMVFNIHGVPKILLRNNVPVTEKQRYDDYEITPGFSYELDETTGKVKIKEEAWTFIDDNGVESISLMAPPMVVIFIKQLVDALEL